jgi:hypothetical protein
MFSASQDYVSGASEEHKEQDESISSLRFQNMELRARLEACEAENKRLLARLDVLENKAAGTPGCVSGTVTAAGSEDASPAPALTASVSVEGTESGNA